MECRHETKYLVGDKDGIVCRNCGARFKSFLELENPVTSAEPPAEKPKAKRTKKTT